jgi:ATP-dependent Clp protease ATP-binding subunit ClpA
MGRDSDKKTTRYRRRCASVVSMITGIPVHKVSENENKKLSKMRDAIEGKVLDKMMPLLRLYALFREDVLV